MGPASYTESCPSSLLGLCQFLGMEYVLCESETPPELIDHVLDDGFPWQVGLLTQRRHPFVGGSYPLVAQFLLASAQDLEQQGEIHVVGHGGVMQHGACTA